MNLSDPKVERKIKKKLFAKLATYGKKPKGVKDGKSKSARERVQ
jgi:hypothetical protein